jgi:hypothetical protein
MKKLLFLRRFWANLKLRLGISNTPKDLKVKIDIPPDDPMKNGRTLNANSLRKDVEKIIGKKVVFAFTGPELPPYILIIIKGVTDDIKTLLMAGYEVEAINQ